mgnify:CR=1 FL=1
MTIREGQLVLADGSVFEGELVGAVAPGGIATGTYGTVPGLLPAQPALSRRTPESGGRSLRPPCVSLRSRLRRSGG